MTQEEINDVINSKPKAIEKVLLRLYYILVKHDPKGIEKLNKSSNNNHGDDETKIQEEINNIDNEINELNSNLRCKYYTATDYDSFKTSFFSFVSESYNNGFDIFITNLTPIFNEDGNGFGHFSCDGGGNFAGYIINHWNRNIWIITGATYNEGFDIKKITSN